MFENILDKKKPDLSELKKIVIGEKELNISELLKKVENEIKLFIEAEKFLLLERQRIETEQENLIKINELKNQKKKYMGIIEKAILEIQKSSSDDAYKVLLVLGKIKEEFEAV